MFKKLSLLLILLAITIPSFSQEIQGKWNLNNGNGDFIELNDDSHLIKTSTFFCLPSYHPCFPKEILGDPVRSGLCDIRRMAPSTRIERVTLPLGGGCSIH